MNSDMRAAIEAHLDLLKKEIESMCEADVRLDRRQIRCRAHIRSIKEILILANNETIFAALG